jgi:hypothetical protein
MGRFARDFKQKPPCYKGRSYSCLQTKTSLLQRTELFFLANKNLLVTKDGAILACKQKPPCYKGRSYSCLQTKTSLLQRTELFLLANKKLLVTKDGAILACKQDTTYVIKLRQTVAGEKAMSRRQLVLSLPYCHLFECVCAFSGVLRRALRSCLRDDSIAQLQHTLIYVFNKSCVHVYARRVVVCLRRKTIV